MKRSYLGRTICFMALGAMAISSCAHETPNISGHRPPDMSEANAGRSGSETLTLPGQEASAPRPNVTVPGQTTPTPSTDQGPPGPTAQQRQMRPTRVAFDGAPIPAFINAVFAETLGFGVVLDPAVASRTESITLRTGDAVSAQDLFDISTQALRDYGVEVIVETPRTLRFTTYDRQRGGTPQVFRGGAVGRDSALGDRPIYYYYAIRSSNMNTLITLLNNTFQQRLQITGSPADNAILMSGSPDAINSALDMLASFDQARMAGKSVATIEPTFLTPTRLADALARVLRTAGYGVSTTPDAAAINVLPIDEIGIVLVFSQDEQLQRFAVDWARQMDMPRQAGGTTQAFAYFVRETNATSLANVLATALGASTAANPNPQQRSGANSAASLAGNPQSPQQQQQTAGASGTALQAGNVRIAVDTGRNALIIMGRAEDYSSILPLLRQLDHSPGEVLIEVVLAEVTINDRTSLGAEFDIGQNLQSGDVQFTGGTGGLGVGNSGLTLRMFDPTSNARVTINALASRKRINILSNPRIVSKSGSSAHIQVGTQVPVLRQQSSFPQQGQNGVTNQVDYIDTGVVLNVRPVIRADTRVDLEISQEVSEAQANNTSDISSPLIFTRSLSTSLSLQDGQTVLLGGLKSHNRSNERTGVPGLNRIPGIGALFQNQAAGANETELLVFITPYIVSNPHVSDSVVDRYRDTMRRWPQVSGGLQW